MSVAVTTDYIVNSGLEPVEGRPIYMGGNTFHCQIDGPTTLGAIWVSNDKSNWLSVADSLGDSITTVTSRPLWAKGIVGADIFEGRIFNFRFVTFKETE